jgi:RNA polymerase sigma-70 factor (ECF subfamily)
MKLIYQEDKRLAKSLAGNNEERFKYFFELYFPKIYRFTINRVDGDKELTKDIVQETLCIAIKNIKQYRGEAALLSWLCQISRSQISLYFRKNKISKYTHSISDNPAVREIFDNAELGTNQSPDQHYENNKLREVIFNTLDSLPNGYGDILEWKYLDKLSVSQIAEKLNTTDISIQSKLSRAREAFRRIMLEILGNHNDLLKPQKLEN